MLFDQLGQVDVEIAADALLWWRVHPIELGAIAAAAEQAVASTLR
jgi:hypothetical protein